MSDLADNIRREDVTIMSPAGSFESLQAALQAGAGAVYFGVDRLNMRSRSSGNFSAGDLGTIVRLCRKSGVKSCLAINTMLYDDDHGMMREIVSEAKKQGVSALIVSDVAAMEHAFREGMEMHLSTQLNIGNSEAVRFFSRYASVIVLARELNLEQVRKISDVIERDNITGPTGEKVKLEMFIHGALCMAISGKCYLSLHEAGLSANRGSCLQICRRAYTVREKESGRELEIDNEYIMSPKDLLTVHFLNKIIAAGATVLKIEGRARSPEYVKTVTECYSEALDAVFDGTYDEARIGEWKKRLGTVFNRGFWDGWYLGQPLGEWSDVYGSKAATRKIYAGKATNYYAKLGVAEFLIENGQVREGDEILIIGPTTGVIEMKVGGMRDDDGPASVVGKGGNCAFRTPSVVRRSDKLYRRIPR
ncbi:MAG: U32 family peptidase [Marinilabiliales bacterium]|nr:MAG: U32 family peptidase [Marinilabiliales bacterium]